MTDPKRFAFAGGILLLLLLLLVWTLSPRNAPPAARRHAVSKVDRPSFTLSTRPTPLVTSTGGARAVPSPVGSAEVGADTSTRLYAVAMPRLSGLPPEARSGTALELWVAWEPPITKQPRIQRLATGVTLDRIVPPVAPKGSPVALLRIPRNEIPSVLYGDRYGSMSAVITGE
jgi:hypothetical protein